MGEGGEFTVVWFPLLIPVLMQSYSYHAWCVCVWVGIGRVTDKDEAV